LIKNKTLKIILFIFLFLLLVFLFPKLYGDASNPVIGYKGKCYGYPFEIKMRYFCIGIPYDIPRAID
jgi:hypothetical protein